VFHKYRMDEDEEEIDTYEVKEIRSMRTFKASCRLMYCTFRSFVSSADFKKSVFLKVSITFVELCSRLDPASKSV